MAFVGRIATGKTPSRVAVTPDGKTLVYALQQAHAVGFADVATRKEIGEADAGVICPIPGAPLAVALADTVFLDAERRGAGSGDSALLRPTKA